jgi:Na+-translocating ferredoxin:NAD+ oxidoreductase RnfD subunit
VSARTITNFFRTPKGLCTIALAILLVLAAPKEGIRLVAPGLVSAVVVAGLIDLLILRWRNGGWEFPSGAVVTGLIVAMVLAPQEPWHVPACTSAVAILSKYVLRSRSANIFNPAALALVAAFYVFHAGQSWWGALPNLSSNALLVLFATGVFIADRMNKIPMVLVFLGTYFLLFTLMAFLGDPGKVADIFRAPDFHTALYFAFFISTDPPTSPVKHRDQILCGALIAVVSFAIFEWNGAAYYLLAGALAGNIWEAGRRWHVSSRRTVLDQAAADGGVTIKPAT